MYSSGSTLGTNRALDWDTAEPANTDSDDTIHLVKSQNICDAATPASSGSQISQSITDDSENTNSNSMLYTVLAAIGAIGAGAFGVLKKKN